MPLSTRTYRKYINICSTSQCSPLHEFDSDYCAFTNLPIQTASLTQNLIHEFFDQNTSKATKFPIASSLPQETLLADTSNTMASSSNISTLSNELGNLSPNDRLARLQELFTKVRAACEQENRSLHQRVTDVELATQAQRDVFQQIERRQWRSHFEVPGAEILVAGI